MKALKALLLLPFLALFLALIPPAAAGPPGGPFSGHACVNHSNFAYDVATVRDRGTGKESAKQFLRARTAARPDYGITPAELAEMLVLVDVVYADRDPPLAVRDKYLASCMRPTRT